jgi:hypothetical protein
LLFLCVRETQGNARFPILSGSGDNKLGGTAVQTFVAWRKENKMPDVVPFVTYEDGIAALEWLVEVFGFTETARFTSSDGRLSHGEMSIGDGLIMLASPSPDYEGPKRHRDNCEIAASWSALPWIIDVFSSMLRTSMNTMLGQRRQEP